MVSSCTEARRKCMISVSSDMLSIVPHVPCLPHTVTEQGRQL